MRLSELLETLPQASATSEHDVDVTSVSSDTRTMRRGALFCCVPGANYDGHNLASEARQKGAVALLVERRVESDLPQVMVPTVRAAMGPVSAAVYGNPALSMKMVGVTGTNGKTTISHLLAAVLSATEEKVRVLGTLDGARTTPEAPALHQKLAEWKDTGTTAVVMEVSSHALVQHRVDGIIYDVAVFANLSQDHLDYHKTMEEYFRVKALLFTPEHSEQGVVNSDDGYGRRLIDSAGVPMTPYSIGLASNVSMTLQHSSFTWEGVQITLHLPGYFNIMNALAAAVTGRVLGCDTASIAKGISSVAGVPGRFETVNVGQDFSVVVDYAHTPDGLRRVLRAARQLVAGSDGRVIVVFGCGGDRDTTKRPLMGRVAVEGADVTVVTSDNPRSEDPMAIIDEVRSGATGGNELVIEPDRRAAIEVAIGRARSGDIVVIAGKGHETGQETAGSITPFDDRSVAREVLEARLVA